MGVKSKVLVPVVLVVLVVGAVILQTQTDLFKGQLRLDTPNTERDATETTEQRPISRAGEAELLPNLSASLEMIVPEDPEGDLIFDVTIENLGPGVITGETPYTYALLLNDVEVFRNTDSYTSMDAGDAISFQYPVSRVMYQYPDSGTAGLIVDTENVLTEVTKTNNTAEAQYVY